MVKRWPDPPTRRAIFTTKIVLMDDGNFGDTADDAPKLGP
jgi:hypothetical protein